MSAVVAAIYHLAIDGSESALRVLSVSGRESIDVPFSFTVTCVAKSGADGTPASLDALSLITATARLSWTMGVDIERSIEAIVDEVDIAYDALTFTLIPRIAAATDAVDHRVFVDRTAIEIARTMLEEHGVDVELRTTRTLPKRAQTIQQFESDLDFVGRLLAEEGITWCSQLDGKGVFFADNAEAYVDVQGPPLPVREEAGLVASESVFHARLATRVVVDEVALQDYDFEKPMLDQRASASSGSSGRRFYEYPGGYVDPTAGRALAAIRLGEARRRRRVLTGETNARRLSAGSVIQLEGREDLNGRWLLIEVRHEGTAQAQGAHPAAARFIAVPAEVCARPERRAVARLGGVETAVISGPPGAEIHPDEYGRVRVKHRWDRRGPGDDHSSAWTRTCQPATSGSTFLPRVGWEVLVGFAGRAGDEPMVLGRLYHAAATPPNSLPGDKIVSAFGTLTSPGGGSHNRFAMNDSAGNEGMSFNASNDFNERTENDKVTSVKASDSWTIGASRKVIVGTVLEQHVSGAESFTVGGMRTVDVGANLGITAASESVTIGGLRGISTGGDHMTVCATFARLVGGGEAQAAIEHQSKFVKGTSVLVNGAGFQTTAGASAAIGVGGASALRVGGGKSVTCAEYTLTAKGLLSEKYASRSVTAGGAVKESFSISGKYDISGAATIEGSSVSVKSSGTITIKAGGVTIKMSAGKIKISGKFDGSVSSDESGVHKYE